MPPMIAMLQPIPAELRREGAAYLRHVAHEFHVDELRDSGPPDLSPAAAMDPKRPKTGST